MVRHIVRHKFVRCTERPARLAFLTCQSSFMLRLHISLYQSALLETYQDKLEADVRQDQQVISRNSARIERIVVI